MSVSKEKIKKALDDFEGEHYVDSKDTLKQEIRRKVNDYLQTELETETSPIDDLDDEDNDEDNDNDEDE